MGQPLECPECAARVAWNGTQFVCVACRWTEYTEKPPSDPKIPVPPKKRDERKPKK